MINIISLSLHDYRQCSSPDIVSVSCDSDVNDTSSVPGDSLLAVTFQLLITSVHLTEEAVPTFARLGLVHRCITAAVAQTKECALSISIIFINQDESPSRFKHS